MDTAMLVISAVGLVAMFGVALLWIGLRGRVVNDHPICRVCRFDLVGLASPAKCPECGADLSRPRAVRIGERRRRRLPLCIGTSFLLLLIVGGGAVGWAQARGYDWNRVKPVWLLIREGEGAGDKRADAALKELLRRQSISKLSASQASDVVRAGLRYQADAHKAWRSLWGDLIECEQMAGRLKDQDFEAFCRHAVLPELQVRPRIVVGSPAQIAMTLNSRVGTHTLVGCSATRMRVEIGEHKIQSGTSGMTFAPDCTRIGTFVHSAQTIRIAPSDMGGIFLQDSDSTFDKPGKQTVRMAWRLRVGPRDLSVTNSIDFTGPGVTWNEELTRDIEVVQEKDDPIELVRDPSIKGAVRMAISVRYLECGPSTIPHFVTRGSASKGGPAANELPWPLSQMGSGSEIEIKTADADAKPATLARIVFDISRPPCPLGFDVFLHKDHRSWPAGHINSEAFEPWDFAHRNVQVEIEDFSESVVDVVLVPSAAAARDSTGLTRIWGENVVIPDVPVGALKNSH
jgi:hypothetical protein